MILIGGSAGSFDLLSSILKGLDKNIDVPIIIILHRLKSTNTLLEDYLQMQSNYIVKEAEDKELVKKGYIYTAPSDYHLLLEENLYFSLDASEEVNYSRPSIDVSFESFSCVLKENCFGVLLSGANQDGAKGLKKIAQNNGQTIVQDPIEAEYKTMPKAAIAMYKDHNISTIDNIITKINKYAK